MDSPCFLRTGSPSDGPDHLNFGLSTHQETLRLSDADLRAIDTIPYAPQTRGIVARTPAGRSDNVELSLSFPRQAGPMARDSPAISTRMDSSMSRMSICCALAFAMVAAIRRWT